MARPATALARTGNLLAYAFVRLSALALASLPLSWVRKTGRLLGDLSYRLAAKRRRTALRNLDLAFGDSKTAREKHAIARGAFSQLAVAALECLWVYRDPAGRVPSLIDSAPEGLDELERCLSRGKGVLFLTAHFGNWEVMGLNHGLLGLATLHSIARRLDNPLIENLAMAFRTSTGNKIFHRDDSPLKIVRALQNNQCAVVMMDQNVAVGGVFVDFFGLKASATRSLALLSLRMGTPILPFYCYPTKSGSYRVHYGPELVLEKTGDREADILNGTGAASRVIEEMIREKPECWMWGHRRWKTRPPGEAGLY